MIVEQFKTDRRWMYFWGKYVRGVDLSVHCARCLLGDYEPAFKAATKSLENVPLRSGEKVFYLCGVSTPYVWAENFHLAVIESIGDVVEVQRHGVYVKIRDAMELPINFDYSECTDSRKSIASYGTCRNWQFATIYGDLIKGG